MLKKLVFFGAIILLLAGAGRYVLKSQSVHPTVVAPVLKEDGTIGAAYIRSPSLFASIVSPIHNQPGLFARVFDANEAPFRIGNTQPDDAIVFSCPAGTSISAGEAFSYYHLNLASWLYGPYTDEASRIAAGEDPNTVFSLAKFGGRATGFFDLSGYVITEGTYFASAQAPNTPSAELHVRCAVSYQCGDAHVESQEDCDDGENNSNTQPDACRTDCTSARCGDDIIDSGEFCDDGSQNGEPQKCALDCQSIMPGVCGDGMMDPGEACDDGNTSNTDGCLNNCTMSACGDGFVDEFNEECDDGYTCLDSQDKVYWCNGTTPHGACVTVCTLRTGDGCDNADGDCMVSSPVFTCTLTEDQNAGVPERSVCSVVPASP